MMLVVSAVTIAVNAAPMMTATAKSITLPRRMKSRNPLSIRSVSLEDFGRAWNVVMPACSGSGSIAQTKEFIAQFFDAVNRGLRVTIAAE
jgi:hypothetical protein